MIKGSPAMSLVAGAASFGASSAVLAAMGLGVPFLPATIAAAICVGLVVHGIARWTSSALPPPQPEPALLPQPSVVVEPRVLALQELASALRHDIRGVLSPALMMADRLLKSEDPGIRRAGQAVVRSIERATTLLAENKRQEDAIERGELGAVATPPRSLVGETAAPAP